MRKFLRHSFWIILFVVMSSCTPNQASRDGRLEVVATTTIVADVVSQVGADHIHLVSLLPPGVDPHSFSPAPRELSAIANADLVFMNGVGLESFMTQVLENAGGEAILLSVSDGVSLRIYQGEGHVQDADTNEHGMPGENEYDPHVWMDPTNVVIWTQNIAAALSQADPENAQAYATNAEKYIEQLLELDRWAKVQVAKIPTNQRNLVTNHDSLGYFADHYGFEIIGAVIPGFSTLAEPSAQDIAGLQMDVKDRHAKAIFVDTTVNSVLAERIAEDTGLVLIQLYSGSLSAANGPAETYLDYMRYNINAIVTGLVGQSNDGP